VTAQNIESFDGVINAALDEAADRIELLGDSIHMIRDAVLNQYYQLSGMGVGRDVINAVLGIIDDFDARVLSGFEDPPRTRDTSCDLKEGDIVEPGDELLDLELLRRAHRWQPCSFTIGEPVTSEMLARHRYRRPRNVAEQ
jgi:hypothetical protein